MEKELVYIILFVSFLISLILFRISNNTRIQIMKDLRDLAEPKVNLQVFAPDSLGQYKVIAEFRPGRWETIIEGESEEYVMDAATELVQFGQFRILRVHRHPVAPIAKKQPQSTPVFKEDL